MNITKHEAEEFIQKLRLYNSWRRGDEGLAQPDPVEIGLLIDWACDAVEELLSERDEASIDAQREAEHHDRMVSELEKVYKERDEAREALEYVAHSGLSARFLEDFAREFLRRKETAK